MAKSLYGHCRFLLFKTRMGNIFVYFHHRALSIKREPGTLQLLGVLYFHNNQLKEAEVTWKEALQLAPSNVETRSNYVSAFSFSFILVAQQNF